MKSILIRIRPSTIALFLILSFFSIGCFSLKPSSTKSGKKLFETFFVGEHGTQYFIKPLLLLNEDTNEKLLIDITFRFKDKIKDSAIVNFSIESKSIYKHIDSLEFLNSDVKFKNKNVKLLFNEKKKKEFISRFTTKLSLMEIKILFEKEDWNLVLNDSSNELKFTPSKKTKKSITILRDNLFVLM